MVKKVFTYTLMTLGRSKDNMANWSIEGQQNTVDEIQHILPGTQSPTLQKDGQNYGKLISKDAQTIVQDENGVNRVLIGYGNGQFGASNYGIKVSQNGYDVLTAPDTNVVLSSAYDMFKIVQSGTATITLPASLASGTTVTTTITHGLGFIPSFDAYGVGGTSTVFPSGQYAKLPRVYPFVSAGTYYGTFQAYAWADATTINFVFENGSTLALTSPGTILAKYYLMQETAN